MAFARRILNGTYRTSDQESDTDDVDTTFVVAERNLPEVQNHEITMARLSGIREINNRHRKRYEKQRLGHIKSPLTQTSLTSLCETLDKSYRSSWYKRIALSCEKIDERISQLSENIAETKKRLRDTVTNIISSTIAFAVVLVNGILDEQSSKTVVTNLSGILLNILLAIKALVEAHQDRKTQTEQKQTLLKEYTYERWEIDRYIVALKEYNDTIDKTENEKRKAQHATEKKELGDETEIEKLKGQDATEKKELGDKTEIEKAKAALHSITANKKKFLNFSNGLFNTEKKELEDKTEEIEKLKAQEATEKKESSSSGNELSAQYLKEQKNLMASSSSKHT